MDSQPIRDNTEQNCLFLLLGVEYWYLGCRTGYFYIPFPAGFPRQALKNRRFDVMITVLQNIQVPWDATVLLGKQIPSWTGWPCRRHYDLPQNVNTSKTVCPARHSSAIYLQFQHFPQFLFSPVSTACSSCKFCDLSMSIIFIYEERRQPWIWINLQGIYLVCGVSFTMLLKEKAQCRIGWIISCDYDT
jgi:hypothetical protein